jgi:hypothetical protein
MPTMRPVSPHRWRAIPTILLVLAALALGAVSARADDGPARAGAVQAAR